MTVAASREQVRQHLASLGYEDVPEDILDEFVADLNGQRQSSAGQPASWTAYDDGGAGDEGVPGQLIDMNDDHFASSSSAAAPSSFSSTAAAGEAKGAEGVTRDSVRRQLADMGYDDVPEQVVDELVRELIASDDAPSSAATVFPPRIHRHNQNNQNRNSLENTRPLQLNKPTQRLFHPPPVSTQNQPPQSTRLQKRQDDSFDSQSLPPRPSVSRPVSAPLAYSLSSTSSRSKKKNDPVRRYHQLKSEWSRDPFLQRLDNPASSRAKERMFGGVGYNRVMSALQLRQ